MTAYTYASDLEGVVQTDNVLSEETFLPGIYTWKGQVALSGTIILDSISSPDDFFIFQME